MDINRAFNSHLAYFMLPYLSHFGIGNFPQIESPLKRFLIAHRWVAAVGQLFIKF